MIDFRIANTVRRMCFCNLAFFHKAVVHQTHTQQMYDGRTTTIILLVTFYNVKNLSPSSMFEYQRFSRKCTLRISSINFFSIRLAKVKRNVNIRKFNLILFVKSFRSYFNFPKNVRFVQFVSRAFSSLFHSLLLKPNLLFEKRIYLLNERKHFD